MNTRLNQICSLGFSILFSSFVAHCRASSSEVPNDPLYFRTIESAGRHDSNRVVTPVNQVVTPYGQQVDLPSMRPQAIALSPDGKILVTSGKTSELVVLDPVSGAIRQRILMPSAQIKEPSPSISSTNILKPEKDAQLSFTGLVFSPDGRRIYLSNVLGNIKVFEVDANGVVRALFTIDLPKADAPRRKEEIPAGLAMSQDGQKLYVALNLSNRLAELDAASGKVIRLFDVGVAPYDVILMGKKAYISNWGGRRPKPGDLTGPAGRGTEVKVDPIRHIANEGSVSVIDLETGKTAAEIVVGLHSSAMCLAPGNRYLVVANAASDNLSVIDTRNDSVIETIWTKQSPADLFGASPNALAFDKKGRFLYAANGTQNAIAVIRFKPRKSELSGLIPVGWFPGAIALDGKRNRMYVANIKGISVGRIGKETGKVEYNSHQYYGSVSLFDIPKQSLLPKLSAKVWENYRRGAIATALLPARPNQKPRPVPERIGEPSVFKHCVYIIKENRTYDQVLGDIPEGNGFPDLCIFGEKITPNQHKMVRDFVLLDNTYCCGILSADGHQWSTTAFGTDYLEKSFAGWPRSYPDGMGDDENDAIAYAPSGFIWDLAIKHGKTLRNYGEFAMPAVRYADPKNKKSPSYLDCYNEFVNPSGKVIFGSEPAVESLRPYLATNTVGWNMDVPDVFRSRYFINELKEYEKNGNFPNLVIICLPNDHTSGTSTGSPTPASHVADNDLAFGQIVEAISHSKFWKETVIFAIEDDPQAGWDHVSGYRTTAYCISPYTKRGAVVKTQYNTTSILRTIEQILGLPPMNQFDATATPMFDCFTETPDFATFKALPNNVPLDQMNPSPKAIFDPQLRKDAYTSNRLPLKQIDRCPEDLFNQILWRAMKGSKEPYPFWAINTRLVDDDD